MKGRIHPDGAASMEFGFHWTSPYAAHRERVYVDRVNLWRDCLPESLRKQLTGEAAVDKAAASFGTGEMVDARQERNIHAVAQSSIDKNLIQGMTIDPDVGRFYPRGILRDIAGVFSINRLPFRCIGKDASGSIRADFNHPLSSYPLTVEAVVHDVQTKPAERGGSCRTLEDILGVGPGMQARFNGSPTDFWKGSPFAREDETDDARFYQTPRFVNHLDSLAISQIRDFYASHLKDGMDVLDLMSSWTSHLPEQMTFHSVTGLGMNRKELEANPVLTRRVIHDLNRETRLPFEDAAFDAVVCTASVEYLVRPFEVFAEAARVLRPGGVFEVTFSNRWFPPKAIRIWRDIHEFERVGLVTEYFLNSGRFENLETLSIRGFWRPADDKYADTQPYADPVYAVSGQVKSG